MYQTLQIFTLMLIAISVSFADEQRPATVEQSQRDSTSELIFELPKDALENVYGRLGKPDNFNLTLKYHGFVANNGYVQLSGSYSRDQETSFEVEVRNRSISKGLNSCMICGDIVFGSEIVMSLPFVIAIAKTGNHKDGHDKMEGHIVWMEFVE